MQTTLLGSRKSMQVRDALKSQYTLETVGIGVEVYVFQGFPPHYTCPYCFTNDQVHALQYRRIDAGFFECPVCKAAFPVTQPLGLVSLV